MTLSGVTARGSNIINGAKAAENSAVTKSTVIVDFPSGRFCTGILLNDHVVLTAAHCNQGRYPEGVTINSPPADGSCSAARVIDFALAPKIAGNAYAPDLALLRLDRAVCAPAQVNLAPLPKMNDVLSAAGYGDGIIMMNGPDFINLKVISSDKEYLKDLYLKGYSNDSAVLNDWHLVEDNYKEFSERYVFSLASQSTQSLCHGDSGGPVYREQNGVIYLYGLIGAGLPHSKKGVAACQNTYLQFFAPIGPSLDWINTTLKAW